MHQNENSRYMFLVKKGRVKVFSKEGPYVIQVKEIGPGGIVGELSLIDSLPRSASAYALEDVEVMIVFPQEMDAINKKLPPWLVALARSIAFRIRTVNKNLERSPENFFKSSTVALIKYKSLADNGNLKFKKNVLIREISTMLRISQHQLGEYIDHLTTEKYFEQTDEMLVIDSMDRLETLHKKLLKAESQANQ